MISRVLALGLIGALGAGLAGCASARRQGPIQQVASPRAHLARGVRPRIAVIVMENEEFRSVFGSPSAPYINSLARRSAVAAGAYAISHPSLPNYLALTGGSTFGISDDCTDCSARGGGLAGQLQAARISWRAYEEDIPSPCFTGGEAGDYAKKHDPFVYYPAIVGDRAACGRVGGLTRLAADERSGLPRFSFITPNLCHDMHDCSVATGDRFLAGLVPPLLRALGRDGLLILTWDEGSSDDGCCRLASGGHVLTILAGGLARRGAQLHSPVDHYSTLQLIEDLFGLRRLGGAACPCTPTLARLVRRGA